MSEVPLWCRPGHETGGGVGGAWDVEGAAGVFEACCRASTEVCPESLRSSMCESLRCEMCGQTAYNTVKARCCRASTEVCPHIALRRHFVNSLWRCPPRQKSRVERLKATVKPLSTYVTVNDLQVDPGFKTGGAGGRAPARDARGVSRRRYFPMFKVWEPYFLQIRAPFFKVYLNFGWRLGSRSRARGGVPGGVADAGGARRAAHPPPGGGASAAREAWAGGGEAARCRRGLHPPHRPGVHRFPPGLPRNPFPVMPSS